MTLKPVWDALKASAGVVITAMAFAIGLAVLVVAQVVVFATRLVDLPG